MKKVSTRFKIIALILILAFTFQSMESINDHTYTTGIDSYHYFNTCFGGFPSHLAAKCSVEGCN